MNNPVHRQRILKCGWLRKQGGMVKTWHRRWFCLNGDCLFYFSKNDDLKPLGSIFLPGNRVDEQPFNVDEPEKFLFEVLPGRMQTRMAPNHDSFLLCAESDDERQDWIRAIRRVMYSGLGGAIFGQSLEETMSCCHHQNLKVPIIIEQCVQFLTAYGLETEGIFRLPGRSTLIKEYKLKYDTAEKVVFSITNIDVHSVASLLKLYLRELPQSIIPSSFYQRFMNIALRYQDAREAKQKQGALDALVEGMRELPQHNYNILKYLCKFLHEVGEKSAINKMTTINLATVFGPNIIRNVSEADSPELMMATADLTQQLAFMMINHKEEIFTMEYDGPSQVQTDLLIDISADESPNTDTLQPTRIHSSNDLVNDVMSHFEKQDSVDSEVFDGTDGVSNTGTQNITPDSEECAIRQFTEDGKPIPPKRRTKNSRIQRGRRLSDRVTVNNKSPSVSSQSDDMDSGVSSHSVNTLALENDSTAPHENNLIDETSNSNTEQLAALVTQNKKLEKMLEEKEAENKSLHWEVIETKSKFEIQISEMKSKYDAQVKKLMLTTDSLRVNYEKRIETMQNENRSKIKELESKLQTEMQDKQIAINRVMDLQHKINEYQLKFGDLSSRR